MKRLQHSKKASKIEPVHIVYIGSRLENDTDRVRACDGLIRRLSAQHELKLIGAIYRPNSVRGRSPDWALSADQLDVVDVVFMEGGWNDDEKTLRRWRNRFPLELAESFVRRGGQLIVADVDQDIYDVQRHSLAEAADLFGAVVVEFDASSVARLQREEGSVHVQRARALKDFDALICDGGFFPSQMHVSDWLKPALHGINSILVRTPILLNPKRADIAASGNLSTTIWGVEDYPIERRVLPWASVNKYGRGHAVLLGAHVSNRVERCPDNATWISNLIALLTKESRRFLNLHPSISAVSAKQFANGDNDEAVFAAFKAVEHRVQTLTGSSDSGMTLMSKVFDEKSAALDIAHDSATDRQQNDEAAGFKFLFMGAMQGLRNPRAHGAHLQTYWPEAMEMLVTASLLMRALDRAEMRIQRASD